MRSRHPHINPETFEFGRRMARSYIDLTRALHEILLTDTAEHFGAENETLLVLLAVFIGDVEDRPMSAPKIATYVGLPRASVYRRLKHLIELRRVERTCGTYRLVPGSMRGDPDNRIRKMIAKMSGN